MHAASPIRCATAVSLIAHAALFLLIGAHTFLPGAIASIPTLTVTISRDDGRDAEQESPPRNPRVIQLAPTNPIVTAAVADDHPAENNPDDEPALSRPAPPPAAAGGARSDAREAAAVSASQEQKLAEANIITTSAESDRVVPAGASQATAAVIDAIPSAERDAMTQKILKWAQALQDSKDTPSQLMWEQDGRLYTAVLKPRPALSVTDIESALVEITSTGDGKRLRTRMQLKRLAFSHFTQLIDRWDTTVQLHDDEVVGRFHSNSEITLGYDRAVAPRFDGRVTTAANGFTIGEWSGVRPRGEIFRGGLETRVARISLPRRFVHLGPDAALENAQYRTFDRDTRITFYPDGTYGWQSLKSGAREERAGLGTSPMILVGARGTDLYVRGTLSGNVLVYSPARIIIESNLFYAHDPRHAADAPDYLGLASDQLIEVARPDITGPGDIEIDAAVYARRSFIVTEEDAPVHATLFIFGSLTAGTLTATEPRYATHVEFDSRFEHTRPPGFPMTNRYELEQWDAQWQEADAEQ